MIVDSHCHLDQLRYSDSQTLESLLDEAREKGVSAFLTVATGLESSQVVYKLARQFQDVWCSAGIHPLHTYSRKDWYDYIASFVQKPECLAVGETGLDYYYQHEKTAQDLQRQLLVQHINLSYEHKKPLIIHTRDAKKDTLQSLKNNNLLEKPGVIHCFTEDIPYAKSMLDMGFYISFTGIITFKNASSLREVVNYVPLDRMMVETDSPYLTPEPFRKKSNNPQYVIEVAAMIAKIKHLELEEVSRITSNNFCDLFNAQING